jgi:hypothetical protein
MTNEIVRRPGSAGLPRIVQLLGGLLAAVFVVTPPSAFACHQTGHTERCVTGYSPSTVSSGAAATVDIIGSRFGSDLHRSGWQVFYGTGAAALGPATVRSWAPASIRVQLPSLAAGTYWLALYNRDGQRRSNQLAGFMVQPYILSPVTPGLVAPAPRPSVPEFYDVAVTLRSVFAGEAGDSASDGDWIIHFNAAPEGGEWPRTIRWPGRSASQNVGDGSSLGPLGPIRLRLRSDQTLLIWFSVEDCDSVLPLGIAHVPGDTCDGEEIWEASGGYDAFRAHFPFSPREWQAGGSFPRRLEGEGLLGRIEFSVEARPAS